MGLPPTELAEGEAETLLDRIDGLLLIGGRDLESESYGAAPTERMESTSPLRDQFELALARAALDRGVPVLGICRGLQILNVARGGTLHQHLLDAGFADHRQAPGRLDEPSMHEIEIEPGSRLHEACGGIGATTVNSHHHQGVDKVAAGATVTARSLPDQSVEALEWQDHPYALGVQWHPEALAEDPVFRAFVEAAVRLGLDKRT